MTSQTAWLQHALQLAEQRRGFCAPNPAVGAVLVKNGQIIGEGTHWANGYPHAEPVAIQAADVSARGASLYVTLEPCCHTRKKTPPCTELIISTGISEVIYGFQDPNPAVSGQGALRLEAAGIRCQYLPLPEIDDFYRSYRFWWQHHRPFVTAKLAISLDGRYAGPEGKRIQLTGEAAAQFTHQQRKINDAILTTIRTIQQDNPLLNVRLTKQTLKKPIYVLDSELRLSLQANILSSAESITLFHQKIEGVTSDMIARKDSLLQRGVQCVEIDGNEQGLDLTAVLDFIGQTVGHHDLWIEAGSRCFTAFMQAKLLQRMLIYIAPLWLGSKSQSAFVGAHLNHGLQLRQWRVLNPDVVCEFL